MAEENYGRRLILKDGTILDDCECGYTARNLWCFLNGVSFAEAFQYFSKPENYETVVFELTFGDITDQFTYTGIERMTAIQQNSKTLDVRLEGYNIQETQKRIFKNKGGE